MSLQKTLQNISDEVKIMINKEFEISVSETEIVPPTKDITLTYANFDKKSKKAKSLESCVLFIDIRKSTKISLSHQPKTLTKLYSSFIRSMIKGAEYFDGKVRNIVGDRVMVLFDKKDCVINAVNTAFLLNTISCYIIDKRFKQNEIKCGIGIDYGKMLVVKTGTIRQGKENQDYQSLVWLGKPANIASKLTDTANKVYEKKEFTISYKPLLYNFNLPLLQLGNLSQSPQKNKSNQNITITISEEQFLENVGWSEYLGKVQYQYGEIEKFEVRKKKIETTPILITDRVYKSLIKRYPNEESVKNNFWIKQEVKLPDSNQVVWGTSGYFTAINEVR